MSEHASITPGQLVQPKEGGPKMTVTMLEERDELTHAFCIWHEDEERREEWYPVNKLEIVDQIDDQSDM